VNLPEYKFLKMYFVARHCIIEAKPS